MRDRMGLVTGWEGEEARSLCGPSHPVLPYLEFTWYKRSGGRLGLSSFGAWSAESAWKEMGN